jgi:hypothetical protein
MMPCGSFQALNLTLVNVFQLMPTFHKVSLISVVRILKAISVQITDKSVELRALWLDHVG